MWCIVLIIRSLCESSRGASTRTVVYLEMKGISEIQCI